MSQELTLFDYAGLPADVATSLQVHAARIAQSKRRMVAEGLAIGAELAAAHEELAGVGRDGQFAPWLASIDMDQSYTYKLIGLHEMYGSTDLFRTSLSLTALIAVSTSDDSIRPAIEAAVQAKVDAGDKVTVAEIQRLKREATETVRKLAELEAISKERKEAASRREANLIEARDKATQSLAKTQGDLAEALADKRRALADKEAVEERAAKEAERAAKEAWQEADEKYETRINQLAREAFEAKQLAEQRARELSAAVAQVQADAKKAADDMAEALVAQKLETRKKELAEIEDKYQRAKKNAEHAANAKERLERDLKLTKDMIQKHEAEMERWASGEAEIATQVKIAADLSEALGRAMTELLMLEHGPQTAAAQKLQKAAQMSRQMAEAIESFLSPRLSANASTGVSNEHHQRH